MEFILLAVVVVLFVVLNTRVNHLRARLDRYEKGRAQVDVTTRSIRPAGPTSPIETGAGTSSVGQFYPEAGVGVTSLPQGQSLPGAAPQKERVFSEELSGRWLGKIGIIAIVLGVSFFLRYAFVHNLIGETGRVVLGFVGGIALIGLGQFLRKKYLIYSDILMGGGIAIFYLTIFAASQFYNMIGLPVALVFMFLVTCLSIVLSVLGGTQHLAALGVFGGFLTPFLLGFGKDNFVGIMLYTLVVDLAVLGISIFKKWNKLNYLGFIGTAALFILSYSQFYEADRLAVTFLFLSIFYVIYLVAGIIHNVLWKKISGNFDLALITLNAAAYGLMSYTLLDKDYHALMGFFMVLLGALYFAIAFLSFRMNPEDRALNFYLPGVAVVFLTVAMPLQFSGHWITLAWLIEAAVLVSAAGVIRRHSMHIFGVIVYAVGLIRFFIYDLSIQNIAEFTNIFNKQFFLLLVAILVAYLIGALLWKHQGEGDEGGRRQAVAVFFIVAHLLTLYTVTTEINNYFAKQDYSLRPDHLRPVYENQFISGGIQSERQQAEYQNAQSDYYRQIQGLRYRKNTTVSIAWTLYAFLLMTIGFALKRRLVRILGMILFFVTAFKVLIEVWQLGEVYRIVSSIGFGVIALLASFGYAKFKDRLKEIL